MTVSRAQKHRKSNVSQNNKHRFRGVNQFNSRTSTADCNLRSIFNESRLQNDSIQLPSL